MKNLKISLTAVLSAIIIAISTGVYAYTGIGVVEINKMDKTLTNGVTTVSGASKYQFVETDASAYNNIKKLEAQYKLILADEAHVADLSNADLEDAYTKACDEYFAKYPNGTRNETINAVLNSYTIGGVASSEECKSAWVSALPEFNASNWTETTDGKVKLDLSTFTGTKYYVAWVEVTTGKYYAEAYQVVGTKTEEPNDEPKNEPATKNETPAKNNKPVQNIKKSTSTAKKLPKTGISNTVLAIIGLALTTGAVSYIKYRKIK